MKYLIVFTFSLLALFGAGVHAKEAAPMAEDPVVEQRMLVISEEMRCLVCQNESLAASRADLAQDLRRELRNLIKEGKTDAEIKEYMVSRYGDFVLYRPQVKPLTWLLWAGPFILLVIGVAFLIIFLKRRSGEIAGNSTVQQESRSTEKLLEELEK